jgi:hypothetical protein
MVKHASLPWKRLRRYVTADPARFAGGSAVSEPLGLLAVERERLAAAAAAARRRPSPATGQEGP